MKPPLIEPVIKPLEELACLPGTRARRPALGEEGAITRTLQCWPLLPLPPPFPAFPSLFPLERHRKLPISVSTLTAKLTLPLNLP